jgi:putative DNA primase/helicase
VLYAVETARSIFREAERTSDSEEQSEISKWAMRSQSVERVKAMVYFAKFQLQVRTDELDSDPYLLNVQNGTIDLKTGELRPHRQEDLITKLAPVEFDTAAKAPRFTKFLRQILVEEELIAFVQRFLGYSLTGSAKERAMAVLHGVGKNGTSTLEELFQDLLGDYAGTTKPETVMQQREGQTKDYHLAELVGVRFLGVSEPKRGAELDEATVKQITGGDTVSARPIYGKPFTYRPQFKLWLSTNHKPEIPDGSEAIWDRLRLIPFTQRFEDGKGADTKLPEKLREELPGVLTWAVRGCVEWHEHGLGTSAAVEAATAAYRSETDVIDRFFSDVCVFGPKQEVGKKALYEAWESWCIDEGADAGSQVKFTRVMAERGVVRGFAEAKVRGTRLWRGIGLVGKEGGVVSPDSGEQSKNVSENGPIDSQNLPPEPNLPPKKSLQKGGCSNPGGQVSEKT